MRVKRFVVADGCNLPFRDRTFDEIHAIHVLEHVPREGHLPFIQEIGRVLTDNGVAYIEVPDFPTAMIELGKAAEELRQTTLVQERRERLQEFVRIRTVGVYGKGRHEGDWHHWGFSCWGLESLFRNACLAYSRESQMISSHHRLEPVLLYRIWRDLDQSRS